MPRALRKWLILSCVGLFIILDWVNTTIAMFAFFGSLLVGIKEGFDVTIMVMCLLFGFLFAGDFVDVLFMKNPERILKTAWSNILSVIISFVWLLLASFTIYGLFGGGLELVYYRIFLFAAIVIIIVNLPSLIFRSALCVPRFRKLLQEADGDMRRRIGRTETT